jgi:UDP-glucose 4-epimerase
MNIGIIGANGFIGSSLLEHFARLGMPCSAFSRRQLPEELSEFAAGEYMLEANNLDRQLRRLDYAIVCTGSMTPADNISPEQIHSAAQESLLIEKSIRNSKTGIVFLSSGGAVYGNTDNSPTKESTACAPISIYGKYKLALERQVHELCLKYRKRLLITRLSNPYGPRQKSDKGQGLIARLKHCRTHNEIFTLWGDGLAVRDYIHIEDFCRFVQLALGSNTTGTYNVGSGVGHSILDIIKMFNDFDTGHQIIIEQIEGRKCDVSKITLDISKAKSELNWHPNYKTKEGIYNLLK